MTTLVVEELKTTLTQNFTIDLNRRYTIAGIRPYIYMHNAPAGTFTLTLKEGVNSLASQTFTSTEIKSNLSTVDNYAHIYKALTFTNPIHLSKGSYSLTLSSSGYTFSTGSYLAWVKEYENIFNTTDGANDTDFNNPMSFQLFEER
jgi:hypothetical protein